jgi:hypothetical protein
VDAGGRGRAELGAATLRGCVCRKSNPHILVMRNGLPISPDVIGFGSVTVMPPRGTWESSRAVEVAAIGDGIERLCLQNSFRLLCNTCKLCPIRAAVRHFVRHDQMMLGIDCDLNIVAHHAGAAAAKLESAQTPSRSPPLPRHSP